MNPSIWRSPAPRVSIVGPSGSGKSTLLNLIGGLDRPTSGEIRLYGQSVVRLSDDALARLRRDKIGFIFQFFKLLPSLSCLENVALPLHGRDSAARKSIGARQLLELVQRAQCGRGRTAAPRWLCPHSPYH